VTMEINRGVALLGPNIQECNTHDSQEPSASRLVDDTIGLLCSQTVLLPRWSCGVEGGVLPAARVV
jgi:hypothetical protein